MRNEILEKVEESFLIAEKFYDRTFERPTNIIFKRSGSTGGHSNYRKRELMFQLDLAEHHRKDFLENTVPHEVAHYVQRAVYGYFAGNVKVMAHGKEWKYIMKYVYKLEPSRCHSYDVSVTKTRRQTRHEWSGCACEGKVFKLTTTRHNKGISFLKLRGYSPYICPSCKKSLRFFGVDKTPEQLKIEALMKQLKLAQANLV